MKKFLIFLILLPVTLAPGCSEPKSDKELQSVIYENIKAMESENLECFMNTIHEHCPHYNSTRDFAAQMFKDYDLKCAINAIKIIEKTDHEAKVHVVQVTERVAGLPYRNNKTTGIHTLKKINGIWKIYHTEIVSIEYLKPDNLIPGNL